MAKRKKTKAHKNIETQHLKSLGYSPRQIYLLQRQRTPFQRDQKYNIGRNDPCHCGSGIKYKKCCMGK